MEGQLKGQRKCEFPGCDVVLSADVPENQRYHSSRCRTAHWRLRKEQREAQAQTGRRDAQNARKRSGRQVSYRKAVRVLALWLAADDERHAPGYLALAEAVLARALPERQRRTG